MSQSQAEPQSQPRGCSSTADDSSSDGSGIGAGEIMLFGVRVKVDPMRKSVSMNNLSQYVQPPSPPRDQSCNNNLDVSATVTAAANTGYASADDAVRHQSNGCRERKRGVPWTEDEHKLFLLGLQKVGKGDWRGISRNFVKTRTPTQVASHAQKYFLRRCNLNRRRRRSSLFDITTDSVAAMPTEQQVNEANKVQAVIQPIPASNPLDLNQNQNQKYEAEPLPMSLNLSLSFNPNHSASYQVISGFRNGDGMISVN
ncbi:hypothetical protein SSX86_000235 [Deinandra increscens subsp. villosa]|uniref:Uncharacterized protein n=1 Tax=Deinandra increscens subsp. villosa TaxID=3103831 RepID=A0AAP0DXJ3_9ASTR